MVIDGHASLVISTRTRRLEELTRLLLIEPTVYWELGDPYTLTIGRLAGRSGVRPVSMWALHISDEDFEHPDDQTGLASLRRLANLLSGKGAILSSLRPELEPTILWSGDSDSSQGGFYLPLDLIRDLGELGCDVMMTVYNKEKKYKKKRRKDSRRSS